MQNTARVFWINFRVSVMAEMQYRLNFLLSLLQTMIALASGLVTLGLVFGQVSELNGWTKADMLVVLGTFTIIGGVVEMLMRPNVNRFLREVQDGTLDFLFVRPIDAQLAAATREFSIWHVADVAVGAVVLWIGVAGLPGRGVTLGGALVFAVGLLLALVIVYGFLSLLCTLAFWFTRVDQIVDMFDGIYAAGRWPVSIYPSWLRAGLSALVPVGLAVTVPAAALTGKLTETMLIGGVCAAVGVAVVARVAWNIGARKYSGASA